MITSLRICHKPASGTQIIDLVGRKSTKELHPDESCLLFMKVHVPAMKQPQTDKPEAFDQDSLFAELESMFGTLEQEILHIEVRYKHSLIHESSTVTARQICKIRRPQTESRWSICQPDGTQTTETGVHERLASYIAAHCDPGQALDLIHYHLNAAAITADPIQNICASLEHQIKTQNSSFGYHIEKPSIVVSDTSLEGDASLGTPQATHTPQLLRSKPSRTGSANLDSPTPAPPRQSERSASSSPSDAADTAREIWRHIRHSSQNTLQRLIESAPETLEQLADSDEVVRELRRKAVANKRSVGAETLRNWKWEGRREDGVAPWM